MDNETKEITVLGPKDLTIPIVNVKRELMKYWDRDTINHNINKIKNHNHKMLMVFLWKTGLRVGEVILVRKQDLDFENYMITARWLKSRKYHQRILPMHPSLRDLLQLYTATVKLGDLIFPMSRQRAWQLVQRYMGGHPHQFRHSFAVNWLRCGCDIVTLHRIMGHRNIQTTMEYLKIVPIDQGKELIKVNFD